MSAWIRTLPLALALAAGPALAQPERPTISVTGMGSASAKPDLMVVDLGVQLVRPTSNEALRDAASRAQALIRALRKAGVDEADIQTRQISIHPRYDYREDTTELRGYEATNVVTIRVRNLDRAGQIIDDAVAAAETEAVVQGVRFDIEADDALVRTARERAWKDARDNAQHLARLADVPLGPPINIREGGAPSPAPIAYAREMQQDASTPVAPGELEVTVTLQVDFAIGPDQGS